MTLRVPRQHRARGLAGLLAAVLVAAGCAANAGTTASVAGSATSTAMASAAASAIPSSAGSASDGLVSIGAGLSGPAGLAATVFAAGAAHVSAFAFDADGHLWFATADYSDTGSDGVYLVPGAGTVPVEVVGALHTPLGLLWFQGSLYVSSAAGVVAYGGFDGTTFTSTRRVVTFPTGVGEVNGIAMGSDGRMVVGVSAPCNACEPTLDDSAAIVSFLPDGSDLRTYASGIRAAVGLAFYPGTNLLFVTMNQRDDLGDATPGDWLAIVAEGQDWGFPDCYGQTTGGCKGTPSAVAVLDQHAAVSGVVIVTGQFGTEVGTAALVAEWAKGTVKAVALADDGTTYAAAGAPFLSGLTNPVPVAIGPDGALYVGDWGTGQIYQIA
jgi:glucose/arabinose dehydrogenase